MSLKIDVINDCYSQMRISGLTVDPNPEMITLALSRLEYMMAGYEIRNICVNYNFEDVPDVNTNTGVTAGFFLMMSTNLACNHIPDFNKEVPQKLYDMAATWLSGAAGASALANLNQVAPPNRQPRGSGSTLRTNRWSRFYNTAVTADDSCETQKLYLGNIDDYKESFRAYLSGETIANVDITASQGLAIQSSSISGDIISYRVKAVDAVTYGNYQQVTIIITTDAGRVETRVIQFEIGTDRLTG